MLRIITGYLCRAMTSIRAKNSAKVLMRRAGIVTQGIAAIFKTEQLFLYGNYA